jgi:DNA-directed RNA polymerase subunit RPC12/RpoP
MKTGKINCRYCGGVRVAENDFCTGCGSPAAIAQQTQPERLARCPKCTDGGVRRHEQSGRYICNQCGFDAHTLDGTKCQNFPSSRNGRRRD